MALPAIRAFRLNSSSGGVEVIYFCSISCDCEVNGTLNRLFRISLDFCSISCDCEVNDGLNRLFRISFDFEVREEIFSTPFSANFLPASVATFFSELSSRLLDCFSTKKISNSISDGAENTRSTVYVRSIKSSISY